jgi:hypothetical protein
MADDSIAGYEITDDFTPKGAYYPDTNTFVNTTLPDTLPDYTNDLAPGTVAAQPLSSDYVYSDANGVITSDGVYKTWAELDELAGVPTGSVYGDSGAVDLGNWWSKLGTSIQNTFLKKDAAGKPIPGEYEIGKILTASGGALGGLAGLMGANKPTTTPSGYQGGIPQLTAVRTALPQPARTPYTGQPAMGRRYFTDTQYVAPAQAAATSQSQTTQADTISQQQTARDQELARRTQADTISQQQAAIDQELARRKAQSVDTRPIYPRPDTTGLFEQAPVQPAPIGQPELAPTPPTVQAAQGGLMAAKGTYLRGSTDGMADELNTSIEGKQPAKLSHGEFVVPADVVSHLGNGNSDAGAKKLYQMMDRIRMARTGTKKQGKEINPDKFMPGGKVGYAQGGIAKFVEGGIASNVPSGTALAGGLTGSESSLSNWAGPYVTNMLAQGQALANQPYQAYTGQLTAGTSPLQQQAFQGAAGLSTPTNMGGFNAQSFTGQGIAQQYMNPYLQAALDPQLAEARRQSQITQTQNAGKLTGAGAYGGGRQAIMDAETQRNLATNLANITGQGYASAYDKAMQQFNTEQQAAQQAQNLTNQYGFNVLGQQAGLGQAQRGIESEAVAADKAQFEEERLNPYKMVQFQQSLLSGLPLAAQTYNTAQPSWLQSLAQGTTFGANTLDSILQTLGINPTKTTTSSGQTGTQSAGQTGTQTWGYL